MTAHILVWAKDFLNFVLQLHAKNAFMSIARFRAVFEGFHQSSLDHRSSTECQE